MNGAKGKGAAKRDSLKPVDDKKAGKRKAPSKAAAKSQAIAMKDPNKPKKPPNDFHVFVEEEFRKTFTKENPTEPVQAVWKAGGKKWKSMSAAEKAPYEAEAAKRKTDYEKEMSAYNKKQCDQETQMAASSSASAKVSLKLLIDSKSKKVLFAEANKDFVDFLFHILSLPVGTVIKLLKKNSMVGSFGNLYDSIENLSDMYMQPNQSKDSVLNPKIVNYGDNVPLLLPNDDVSTARKVYMCQCYSSVSEEPATLCPDCNSQINIEVDYVTGGGAVKGTAEGGGFVKGMVTYMVMDDLVVKPMCTISIITMSNKFNVKEVGALEEKVVSVEMKEGLMLLKESLQCKNVLTTVFLS